MSLGTPLPQAPARRWDHTSEEAEPRQAEQRRMAGDLDEGYSAMKFGSHTPLSVKQRTTQSPMAVFARGLQTPGEQWKFGFPNGYGASVINDGYGGDRGLYELAVLDNDRITYETPITSDVLGYLTDAEVAEALDKVAALPARVEASS